MYSSHRFPFPALMPLVGRGRLSLAVLVALVGLVGPSSAQITRSKPLYRVLNVNKKLQSDAVERKKLEDIVKAVLTRGQRPLTPANQTQLNRWYKSYKFPRMTQPEARTSTVGRGGEEGLGAIRRSLRDTLRKATSKQAHDHLNLLTRRYMHGLAKHSEKGNFHPAVRYTAMLIIGDLNQQMTSSTSAKPPVPLRKSLPIMLKELDDPKQIDHVRIAALVGIFRYSRLSKNMPQTTKTRVITPMLDIVQENEPPEGRKADVHLWIQRRAVDVLGAVRSVGPNGAVATALDKLVTSTEAHLMLRCGAAEALGRLNYPTGVKLNPSVTAAHLGSLAVDACRVELERAKYVYIDPARSNRDLDYESEEEPFPPKPGVVAFRRRLKQKVDSVLLGLMGPNRKGTAGVASLAKEDPHKTVVGDVKDCLDAIINGLDVDERDVNALRKEVAKARGELERVLRNVPAGDAAELAFDEGPAEADTP